MTPTTPTPPFLGEREAVARTIRKAMRGTCTSEGGADIVVSGLIEPLRTENETLRAEVERLKKLNNTYRDEAVQNLNTTLAGLNQGWSDRVLTAEAERDAAIARAEEAEGETRDARYKADCAEEDECDALGRAEEAESKLTTLRAELAQAKTQVAGMRRAFFKVAMIQARELQRMEPAGTTPPDLDAAMAELRRTLTNPEPPHGD